MVQSMTEKVHPDENESSKKVESRKNLESTTPVTLTKSQRNKILALLVIGIVISVIVAVILSSPKSLLTGPAPDFTVEDIDGNRVSLRDYRGKVVLLDFFRTTCHFCQQETPNVLVPLDKEYGDQIVMISISISAEDTDEVIRNYIDTYVKPYGANWTFTRDTDSAVSKYNVEFTPTTYLIDENGDIALGKSGYDQENYQLFNEKITSLLER